jgi:hypothetical protein
MTNEEEALFKKYLKYTDQRTSLAKAYRENLCDLLELPYSASSDSIFAKANAMAFLYAPTYLKLIELRKKYFNDVEELKKKYEEPL